jgi:hypothetical protein
MVLLLGSSPGAGGPGSEEGFVTPLDTAAAAAVDDAEDASALPMLSAAMLAQAQQPLFPLSSGLEALVALSQGFVSSSGYSAGFSGLGAGAPGMLPFPAAGMGVAGSSSRGVEGLTLLGPVLEVAGAAGGRGSSSSPRHRPKQPSIAEQLEELQHILSADMAAEAAAAAVIAEEEGGHGDDSPAADGDCTMDESVSPAATGSAAGSEGGTTEEGIGFEAVGLDGLPVYGPHLPPNCNSEDEEADTDEELLRLLQQQQQHHGSQVPRSASHDSSDNQISVERMLQLLSINAPQGPHSAPLVVSGPPMPLQNLSGSPVTAIEELGNVTSASSAGSRAGDDVQQSVGSA